MSTVADVPSVAEKVSTTTLNDNDTCTAKKKSGTRWGFIIIASLLCVIVMNLKSIMRLCKTLATRIRCTLQPNNPNADAMNIVETNACGTTDHLSENTEIQEIDEQSYYRSMFVNNEPIETQAHEAYDPIIEEETSPNQEGHDDKDEDTIQVQQEADTPENIPEGSPDDTVDDTVDDIPDDVPDDTQVQSTQPAVAPKKRQPRKKKELV